MSKNINPIAIINEIGIEILLSNHSLVRKWAAFRKTDETNFTLQIS
jgi:hypothetical protein